MESMLEESNKINIIKENFNLNFKNIKHLSNSFTSLGGFVNSFCVFISVDDILSLIYTNKDGSMIYYNIDDEKKIFSIKNAHPSYINNYIHYLDKANKRDLLISVSCKDNLLKLWDINKIICLLSINGRLSNQKGVLFSSCFLNQGKDLYILISNCNLKGVSEPIKVYNFKSELIKRIYNSNKHTFYIDTFYDKKNLRNYIIACNKGSVVSYDYEQNKIYKTYKEMINNNDEIIHIYAEVLDGADCLKVLESCYDGNIRVWKFNTGELLSKIRVIYRQLYGFCLWDEDHLLLGCNDKSIKLVDLKKEKVVKSYFDHCVRVVAVKKIKHKKYGECLISQGADNNGIKLWVNNKDYIFDEDD